jgi:LysR family transcriptional regulator, glycine cleavage system transcriptional activator
MKGSRLPPLVALRAFDAVGRRQSIRSAGDELAVSHTVVSRHLRNLEEWLGVKLIEARGRGVVLTAEGMRYHEQIGRAFEAIARATADLRPAAQRKLIIWCFPGLANRRLLVHLPELEALLPDWEIFLHPTLARSDLVGGEAHAEVIYTDRSESADGVCTELLARPRVFPVASPTFMARYPGIETISDLLRLPLIHEESTDQWERWFGLAGISAPHPLSGPRLWHAHLAIEAARLGQGVALANELLVEEDLKTGALMEIVPSDIRFWGYYLRAPAERWNEPHMVALRGWLQGLSPTR